VSETGAWIKSGCFSDRAAMPAIADEWHRRRGGTHGNNEDGAARIGPEKFIGWRKGSWRPEVHITSVLPLLSFWNVNSDLEPKFLLRSNLFLAVSRLYDTMAAINLDSIKFYQPPSTAVPSGKNPMMTFQHIGESAGDTGGGNAGIWNPVLIKMI